MYRRNRNRVKTILIFIIFFIIAIIIMAIYKIYGNINVDTYKNNTEMGKGTTTIETEENKNKTISKMLEESMSTIVGISKIRNNGLTAIGINNTQELGIGSGVIISEKGYILTNEHVSGSKYSTCYVTLENGEILTASVVWADEKLDLSIIKVSQQFSNYAKLGDSENINIGETVYAIGNPIGMEFQRTVTSGIISAKNRTITFEQNGEKIYMDNLIQTDATINPGNSGGPLLNIYGGIIGINTVKITSAEGIGFAVPINIIKPIIEKLESDGKFEEASIGILGYDSNIIKYLDYNAKIETGIYVLENITSSSQIQKGDNIIKIDNKEIKKMSDLKMYIYSKMPGDNVNLVIIRNNKQHNIEVKLGKRQTH